MVAAIAATPRVQAEVVTVCGDQGGSVLEAAPEKGGRRCVSE